MERPVFANTVTVTANSQKTEFVLTFSHKYPSYDASNGSVTPSEEVVSSVLIGGDLASLLEETLGRVINMEETNGECH